MRTDWVPLSASALVIGAMSLVFGSLLNPADPGASTGETLRIVQDESARYLAMAVMFFLASVTLTLGLPAILTLFERRGRKLGLTGVALFSVGAIGTCGYAMLLVFFRALAVSEALRTTPLDKVSDELGLAIFLQGWIACFYGGVLLIGIGLLLARTTARWVPLVLIAFVVLFPVSPHLGRVGMALQVLGLAVAFTGVAMAAVTGTQRALTHQPAF